MPDLRATLDRAATTLDDLARTGEAIEDEWQYVTDLHAVWRARLAEVATARGRERLDPAVTAAVEHACAEAAMIADPHRAIDWLSTFPQVILLAVGEAG